MDLAGRRAARGRGVPLRVLLAFIVLFSVMPAGGCGKSGKAASTSRAASSKSVGTVAVAPSPSITGDTDGDDEANASHAGDADNDDSKPTDQDNDSDSNGKSYFDADDAQFRRYGHAAGRRDRLRIARLVKRYYKAAAAGDGMSGCALMAVPLAGSLPQTLAGSAGPPYTRGVGNTCRGVLKAVFVHYHRQLAAHLPTLSVSDVRLEGSQGNVVVRFDGLPGRIIGVARERGAWKINAVVDLELP